MRFETIELTKQVCAMQKRIPRSLLADLNDASLSVTEDFITGDLVVTLRSFIWSRKIADQDVRYPATWWDAFKARWFPRWAQRRWPVVERVVSFTAHHDYPGLRVHNHEPTIRIDRVEYTSELMS